jgi:hypothetical protein
MLGPVIYVACAATALLCAVLLLRAYQTSRARLLLWSGLCFTALTVNNVLVAVDLVLLGPEVSLFWVRNLAALVGLALMLYGLIWDAE